MNFDFDVETESKNRFSSFGLNAKLGYCQFWLKVGEVSWFC